MQASFIKDKLADAGTPDELVASQAPTTPSTRHQNWAVIIALAPKDHGTTNQYCKQLAANFLGAFDTVADAKEYIKLINSMGFDKYDLHIVQMNCFFPLPPPIHVTDTVYCQNVLSEVFAGHRNNAEAANTLINERIQIDKKAEDILRGRAGKKNAKSAALSITNPSAADSVGVVVDSKNEKHKPVTLDHTTDLNKKLTAAKNKARRKGIKQGRKRREAIQKLFSEAVESIKSSSDQHHEAGSKDTSSDGCVFDGLPSVNEVAAMTPEEKDCARRKLESMLPDPMGPDRPRCLVGKPQLNPPKNARVLDLKLS